MARGLHVDHIHLGSHHAAHHAPSDSGTGLDAYHSGDDAVDLIGAGTENLAKRVLPGLVVITGPGSGLDTPEAWIAESPAISPRDPPHHFRSPGRAPPA